MSGAMSKDAWDYIPFCQDQGMPNLVGTFRRGESVQKLKFTMVAGGVVNFEAQGLSPMENDEYVVLVQNQTDAADEATIGTVTTAGFVITGPDNDDELDIIIMGQLKGQLA